MLKFTPFLLAIGYALVLYQFSVWRTRRTLDRNSTELADPILRVMTDRMAEVLGVAHVPVHIYEVDPVNGLAAPDGRIFLTRGFYRRYRAGDVTAAELASVIAHELGHVALGHTRRRMIDFTGQNALLVSLAALFGRVIPVIGPLVAAAAARLVTTLLAARLSGLVCRPGVRRAFNRHAADDDVVDLTDLFVAVSPEAEQMEARLVVGRGIDPESLVGFGADDPGCQRRADIEHPAKGSLGLFDLALG